MQIVSATDLERIFTWPTLIEALADAFRTPPEVPVRHHHAMARAGEPDATLLLMPAWSAAGTANPATGVKIVTVTPGNAGRGLPSVAGTYLLMDGTTGEPRALIDGKALTLWRTAAASALAASFLARKDARRMTMVGAGALAPFLIAAHASVRAIEEVTIWNRDMARASALAASLAGRHYSVRAVSDLEAAVRDADLVSCATLSTEPLVRGDWLAAGTHLDLVGAFTPAMRESDDAAVSRSTLYVDTRDGALAEAGDLRQPLDAGIIVEADIAGDLFGLCSGQDAGRRLAAAITLFKSVGTALEDFAAARLAVA